MRVQYGEECTKEESSWSICIKYEILPFTDKVAVEKQQTLLRYLGHSACTTRKVSTAAVWSIWPAERN